ncbi:MAG: ABC transporter substrate-binding protein, partial [Desulfobacteraceae bacterium]|nr:ABC transporter substrate-binding protein [Desulfobacteraceae bacterium]
MNAKQRRFSCRWVLIFGCATMLFTGSLIVASSASAANMLKMGLLQEPKTLNVWRASDTWSRKVLGLLYQPLYVRDPKTLELIPWLAAEQPLFDEKTLSYTVKLRPAKWSDGTELTSEDVAFTGNFI